ncbi:RIP metalloprotease RseP [Salinarimonas ramus]|uniref:Zinc metalloprotease n=1 Tax=Salinarimonas ramus TaxID=690164 RepID=A0A917Q4T7_9HYPH|nr:RIP metalloprotease RseP [Salinarimonas ramus]GGK26430.1 putative zinc metalloprotease [Salinarimonas ramus]
MEFLGAIGGGAIDILFGYLVPFIFVLAIVVFVHEMGHFLVGRWCGVGVQAFSIGFGPELIGWNDRRGTRWKVCAVPLGGYVKFFGDAGAASTPDNSGLSQMSEAEKALSFHHKPVAQRAAIVAAGPIANFILAILVFAAVFWANGRTVLAPQVDVVLENSAAERAGFQSGDLIVEIDGRSIVSFNDMQRIVSSSAEDRLAIVVERAGERVTLEATPERRVAETAFGAQRIGMLGIQAANTPDAIRHIEYGPIEAIGLGAYESYFVVERTFDYLGQLITGRESADQLSGPIRIAKVSGEVAEAGGIVSLITLMAVLSVSIGLINLFPVPMLDGGHLMFYAVEAVRGRPLSENAQEIGFRIGFALVIFLMLFATWNDIVHLIDPLTPDGT